MVIAIDTVRYCGKLEKTGTGRSAVAEGMAEGTRQEMPEDRAPARGILCGLFLSGVLWVGLVAAARALFTMAR